MVKLTDRCFCCFTAAMLVPLGRILTWRFHTKLRKFGWNTFPNNARVKNHTELILGKVFHVYFIYHIPDSWLKMFYFPFHLEKKRTTRKRRKINRSFKFSKYVFSSLTRHQMSTALIVLEFCVSLGFCKKDFDRNKHQNRKNSIKERTSVACANLHPLQVALDKLQ